MNVLRCLTMITEDEGAHTAIVVEPVHHGRERGCSSTVAYGCHVQRFRRDVGIAVAREFARYRLLRVPLIGVPRAVVRDRHAGRREARAVPAEGPMQADFFRHQADIWQEAAG